MIVTLAGHVDHGKTTLVRLLTGTDTDRLAEEQRRGLTIDLGFAYLRDGEQTLGFVDVPGHHRFIHNMVAGVAARQHALLVIAADDGPMPQSREHLQILSLIGVRRGLIALTKCDRVDATRRAEARDEIEALVAGSFLEGSAIIETAAATGAGLEALRAALFDAARTVDPAPLHRPFRMAIDRAFTLKGTGLVVTGTVHAGAVATDQDVFHFPSGRRARVRSLRVQDQPATQAAPGDRAALNLAGLDIDDVGRGDWLASHPDPGHRHLVIELETAEDFPRTLRQWMPVHVYHASRHTTARLARIDDAAAAGAGSAAEPGESAAAAPRESPTAAQGGSALAASGQSAPDGSPDPQRSRVVLAELDCDDPLFAKHGDRVVIRDQGLDRTLGGGRVIDNRTRPRRRNAPARLASIGALRASSPERSLAALLDLDAVDLDDFQRLWDLTNDELEALCAAAPATRHGRSLILDATWSAWSEALLGESEARHAADPALQGLQENAFESPVPATFRSELLRQLVAAGKLEHRAGRYRPARLAITLSPQEAGLLAKLQPLLAVPQPMSLGDMGKTLNIPLPALQRSVRPLVTKGVLVQINDKRIYLPEAVTALAHAAAALGANGPFSAAEFRDAAGIGRNIAIDILEFFDARRFTRRQGEVRLVVGDPGHLFGP